MDNSNIKNTVSVAQTNAGAGFLAGVDMATKLAMLEAAGTIHKEDGFKPFIVTPTGAIATVEHLRDAPLARRGTVAHYEALSFARFVNRFKSQRTVIFADQIGRKFTAALDYHPKNTEPSAAGWDLFRTDLTLKHTKSWSEWSAVSGQAMTQEDFAQFLEDHIPDIAVPEGAKLVEIARTLEAKTDVQFESHIRAQNGAHRFVYLETVNATAQGTFEIPQDFTLILQPFEGSKQYEVKARFRYRITSKKLSMWFDLVRLDDVLKEAFNDELMKIEGEVNGSDGPAAASALLKTPIYNGPAPAAQQPKE